MEVFNTIGYDLTDLTDLQKFIKSFSSGPACIPLFSSPTLSFSPNPGLLFIPEPLNINLLSTSINPINSPNLHKIQEPENQFKSPTPSDPSTFDLFPFFSELSIEPFSIRCNICYKKSSDYFKLDCSHSFCTNCLHLYFNSLIDSFKLKPKNWPCPECESPIKKSEFLKHLNEQDLIKFKKFKIKKKGMNLVANSLALFCPKSDCPGYGYLFTCQDTTACIYCKCALCLLCGKESHPSLNCEENDETERDSEFDEFLLQMGWKKCPVCGAPVEKIEGCQFLTCLSQNCIGDFHFCNICGKSLTTEVHFGHFSNEGVFGDSCNTLDGLPDIPD